MDAIIYCQFIPCQHARGRIDGERRHFNSRAGAVSKLDSHGSFADGRTLHAPRADRISPTAKTPSRLVSSMMGGARAARPVLLVYHAPHPDLIPQDERPHENLTQLSILLRPANVSPRPLISRNSPDVRVRAPDTAVRKSSSSHR